MTDLLVRTGRPEDVHPMMDLALMACEENGMTAPNPIKLLSEIWSSLNLHRGIIGIIGDPIEAAILLRVEPMWYSDEMSIIERAVFVHPGFRAAKGGRAKLLCEWAKKVADDLGYKMFIGILSNHRTQGKVKLYSRQFGEPAGAYFIYTRGQSCDAISRSDDLRT